MDEEAIAAVRRYGRVTFMAVVTTVLLALTFAHFARGLDGLPTALVYAFTVGFGLEFVGTTWRSHWAD